MGDRRTSGRRILQITSYPPPRAGWGVRVEFLKKHLESHGHVCTVLNIGRSRFIPSPEYETVVGGLDYARKVWRFSRRGFVAHVHVNGDSPKGFALALIAEVINVAWGKRCFLTFHAGVDQIYFPRSKAPWLLPMYKVLFAIPRRIVCNSEAVKEKIAEYGVPRSKIHPIPAFSRQYLGYEAVTLRPDIESFYARYRYVLFTYVRIREGFYLDTLLDGFTMIAGARADVGLALCGVSGDVDPVLWRNIEARIASKPLESRVCVIDDLNHDEFLVALTRSAVYLRTPTTDGVASSVLEALALGVPVVAAENGTRPPGCVTYRAADAAHLVEVVTDVLERRDRVIDAIPHVEIRDTLTEEANLLTQ